MPNPAPSSTRPASTRLFRPDTYTAEVDLSGVALTAIKQVDRSQEQSFGEGTTRAELQLIGFLFHLHAAEAA